MYIFYPRPLVLMNHLQVGVALFDRPKWDVIVLHPQGLLPNGETLPFASSQYFQTQNSPPPQYACIMWTYWVALDDQLISSLDLTNFFPPFIAQDARSMTCIPLPPISSLAMVMNAHAKLQSFMRSHSTLATPQIIMIQPCLWADGQDILHSTGFSQSSQWLIDLIGSCPTSSGSWRCFNWGYVRGRNSYSHGTQVQAAISLLWPNESTRYSRATRWWWWSYTFWILIASTAGSWPGTLA